MENTEEYLKEIMEKASEVRKLHVKGTAPYFNEKNAEFASNIIQRVTTTKAPFIVSNNTLSTNTIRQKYFQGCRYLKKFYPEKAKLAEMVECQRLNSDKLVFVFKPREFVIQQLTVDWREKFQHYIDTAVEHQIFNQPELAKTLTEQEKAWCVLQLEQLGNRFIWIINDDTFKIIKEEQI